MQEVSAKFWEAIKSHERPYDEVIGTVDFADGSSLNITPEIMPSNSINIIRQCISDDELEFGGVFLDTLEMSLRTDKSRYAFYGATVDLSYRILLDGYWETVKLGKFTISEADRPDKYTVKFKAFDDMRLLDKKISSNATQGTPFDILQIISDTTGYPLSFTESDMSQFVNSSTNMYLDNKSGISTYRDAVKVVCQLLGCFARDNRSGEMELVKFGTTSSATLDMSDWYSITPADYLCNYVGLSVTGEKGTYVSVTTTEDVTGNTMVINDAPAWDYGLDNVLQAQTDALFNVLSHIVYTPCEIDMPSNPVFDCGDRLTVQLSDGTEIETIITSYEWKWHSGMEISSKGINPYLQGASTSDIASKRLLGKDSAGSKFTYYTYINANKITLTDKFKDIVSLRVMVGDTTTVSLWHEFKWLNELVDSTQSITLNYYLDGVKFDYEPVQTYGEDGIHTWGTQFWLQDLEGGIVHVWKVKAKLDSGSCIIDRGDLHALIQGQNLASQDTFSGIIELTDEVEPYVLGLDVGSLADRIVALSAQAPRRVSASDRMQAYVLGVPMASITDSRVSLTAVPVQFTRVMEDSTDEEEIVRVLEDGGIRLTEG